MTSHITHRNIAASAAHRTSKPLVKCGHCGAYETVNEVYWCALFDPAPVADHLDPGAR